MADYENSIFGNLPRLRGRAGEPDDGERSWREVLSMRNFEEGPLPPRPERSGKGGPSINQTSKPPVVTSVWSASDAAANGMTLSNGGLTVTPSGGGAYETVRGSIGKTSGKLYVEITTSQAVSTQYILLGVASASFVSTAGSSLGSSNYSFGSDILRGYEYPSAGFTTATSGSIFAGTTISSGDVLAIAIDFTAQNIWFAKNNIWLGPNNPNPATGTNPFVTFVAATVGALFPAMSLYGTSAYTIQSTAASQKYLPPPGFQAWDGGPVTPTTSVWSASDASANAMTLSNGGLTVNNAAALSGSRSIRTTNSHTSGKVYIEFLLNVNGVYGLWGLGSSSFDPTTFFGNSPYSAGIYYANQNFVSTGFTSNYPASLVLAAGDVIGLAVDFAAGGVWLAQNNGWELPGNPATGASPIISFTPATVGPLFAGLTMNSAIGISTWILQSTAASQKYAPPSGFTAWG